MVECLGNNFPSLNSSPGLAAVVFDYILSSGTADTMPSRSRASRIRITVPPEWSWCRDTASGKRNNKPPNGVRNCGHSAGDWMQSCCGSSAKQFRLRSTVSVASDWTRPLQCSFPNDFLIDIPHSFSRYEYFLTSFEKQTENPLELDSIETARDIFRMIVSSVVLSVVPRLFSFALLEEKTIGISFNKYSLDYNDL